MDIRLLQCWYRSVERRWRNFLQGDRESKLLFGVKGGNLESLDHIPVDLGVETSPHALVSASVKCI